jgi:threonine dehydratase
VLAPTGGESHTSRLIFHAEADDTYQSIKAGKIIPLAQPSQTIADGLRTATPGNLTFPIMKANLEDVITVSDEEIKVDFFLFFLI